MGNSAMPTPWDPWEKTFGEAHPVPGGRGGF